MDQTSPAKVEKLTSLKRLFSKSFYTLDEDDEELCDDFLCLAQDICQLFPPSIERELALSRLKECYDSMQECMRNKNLNHES